MDPLAAPADAPRFLPFSLPGVPNVGCAFQIRTVPAPDEAGPGAGLEADFAGGGLSPSAGDDADAVLARRRSLCAILGVDAWAEMSQVHGDDIVFDPPPASPEADSGMEADGMATSLPGLALMIRTADCQPILLAHRSGRFVAALHAGWRGSRMNFPGSGVRRFCDRYGILPRDVLAVRGPSLGPACAEFVNFEKEWDDGFRPWFDEGTRCMDLWSLTRDQLQEAGVPGSQIFGLDWCTRSSPWFFSYRRARRCGRQASLIWIRGGGGR